MRRLDRIAKVVFYISVAALLLTGPYLAVQHAQVQDTTVGRVYYTATKTVASGTLALNTTAVTSGTCGTAQTAAATGLLTTDTIQLTINADPTGVTGYTGATTGGLLLVPYPTADTVNVKVCNRTGADITPGGTVTLNFRVTR